MTCLQAAIKQPLKLLCMYTVVTVTVTVQKHVAVPYICCTVHATSAPAPGELMNMSGLCHVVVGLRVRSVLTLPLRYGNVHVQYVYNYQRNTLNYCSNLPLSTIANATGQTWFGTAVYSVIPSYSSSSKSSATYRKHKVICSP